MQYTYDFIDGVKVPPTIITEDTIISGTHKGSIYVEKGTLTLSGTLQGSLSVQEFAKVLITGKQQGSVTINSNATVLVHGEISGSTNVMQDGIVIIEPTGKLAGSLSNDGEVIIRGVFGGSHSGNDVLLEGSGYIKQPILRNGAYYYNW